MYPVRVEVEHFEFIVHAGQETAASHSGWELATTGVPDFLTATRFLG